METEKLFSSAFILAKGLGLGRMLCAVFLGQRSPVALVAQALK
jgi:hypothetical protein